MTELEPKYFIVVIYTAKNGQNFGPENFSEHKSYHRGTTKKIQKNPYIFAKVMKEN